MVSMVSYRKSPFSSSCTFTDSDGKACISCKKSDDLETCIVEVEELVALLKSERLAISSTVNSSHDLIGRLPREIASHIFKYYADVNVCNFEDRDSPTNLSINTACLFLGAVCSSWRTIVYTLPDLWVKLMPSIYPTGKETALKLAAQWRLDRTNTPPLSICLYISDHTSCTTRPHIGTAGCLTSLIGVINTYSSALESLDPTLACNFFFDGHGYVADKHSSFLQHLHLIHVDSCRSFLLKQFIESNPRHFPYNLNISTHDVGSELKHVTHLVADDLLIQECLEILQEAPTLTEFTLNDIRPYTNFGIRPSSYHFLNDVRRSDAEFNIKPNSPLRSLTLWSTYSEFPSDSARAVLDDLTLPSLEKLTYYSTHSWMTMNSLIKLIRRSPCKLRELYFFQSWRDNYIAGQIVRLLQMIPSLRILKLCLPQNDDIIVFLKHLSKTESDSSEFSFLPNLELLIVEVDFEVSDSDQKRLLNTLLDVFEPAQLNTSHNEENGPPHANIYQRRLRKVKLLVGNTKKRYHMDQKMLDRFSKILAQGIDISILYSDD